MVMHGVWRKWERGECLIALIEKMVRNNNGINKWGVFIWGGYCTYVYERLVSLLLLNVPIKTLRQKRVRWVYFLPCFVLFYFVVCVCVCVCVSFFFFFFFCFFFLFFGFFLSEHAMNSSLADGKNTTKHETTHELKLSNMAKTKHIKFI